MFEQRPINNHSSKISKIKLLFYKFSKNLILLHILILLLPNKVLLSDEHYINIKVNKKGYNQILSDEYIGILPSKILINEKPVYLNNKKIYVNSTNDLIQLHWDNTLSNFSYMFCNLTNINYIYMYYMFGNICNLSYIFKNCYNLRSFSYLINYNAHSIVDMKAMFYNCLSLLTFYFHDLTFLLFFEANMSYMFYNCKNLLYVSFDSHLITNINDLKGMFYNCISLRFINLQRIQPNRFIDVSYMFYNCQNLEFLPMNNLGVTNMSFMFYNCTSLSQINLNYFITSSNINMSYAFYNCTNLVNIEGNFNVFSILDTREMFYNCISLNDINFLPMKIFNNFNMSKMFYNCNNIKTISFNIYNNGNNLFAASVYIMPNDLSSTFYNCTSLISLSFNYLKTDYTQDISYMFYNCKNLKSLNILNSFFSNTIIKNMRSTFQNCESLETLDLSSFYTPSAEIMWDMFKGCSRLKILNIDKFDTSKVTDMESMFEGCSNLKYLSLIHFRTTKVHYMNRMFRDCINLERVDFKYISSESLGTMHEMFYNCSRLQYINIYSLTEKVQSVVDIFTKSSYSFEFCINDHEKIPMIFEELLKLPNVKRDCSTNCYPITRAPIPDKKLCCPKYIYDGDCINECPLRTKINNENNECEILICDKYYDYKQKNCLDNIPEGYYLNDTELKTIDKCHETCQTCNEPPTLNNSNCLTCKESNKYFYFGNCYTDCKNGYYIESGIFKCNCLLKECSNCSKESDEKELCLECSEGYYPIEDDDITKKEIDLKKCYHEIPINYFLDNITLTYKKCYSSCYSCQGYGNSTNHNCIRCLEESTFEIVKNNNGIISKNCYKNCANDNYKYFYIDNDNNYICTKKCIYPFYYLVEDLNQCVKDCNDVEGYNKIFQGKCYKECPVNISSEIDSNNVFCKPICPYDYPYEIVNSQVCVKSCTLFERKYKICINNYIGNIINLKDLTQKTIIDDIINSFNTTLIDSNSTFIIEENETIYEILTSDNKNKNNKTSSIDLLECEAALREYNIIDEKEHLYILKIDTNVEGKTGPTVLYQVYRQKKGTVKLEQLDLTLCEGMPIKTSFPLEIENPDIYDINNPIYNSICYSYSTKDGVDMTVKDRREDCTENNRVLCGENCDSFEYDKENKHVECKCDALINLPYISELKIDKKKLYKFMNIKKIGNFDVLKCYNLVFSLNGLKSNLGFYFFIPTVIMYIICIIIFYKYEFDIIKKYIKDLMFAKIYMKYLDLKTRGKIKRKHRKETGNQSLDDKSPQLFQILKAKNIKIEERFLINNKKHNKFDLNMIKQVLNNQINYLETNSNNNINIDNDTITNNKLNNSYNSPKKSNLIKTIRANKRLNIKWGNINIKSSSKNSLNTNNEINFFSKMKKRQEEEKAKIAKRNKKRIIEIMKPNDAEMNDYEYKEAIKHDKRTFTQFYFSLLKTDHMLLKIINKNDYNSRVVKVYLFFLDLDLNLVVNALFFNDETMHKILEDDGEYNFIYQLPQIIYSTIISFIFGTLFSYFGLSEDKILEFKKEKIEESLIEKKGENLIQILFYKFLNFFIFSFLIILAFWYYIASFCAVYKNTQYHLIKDTLIGLATSFFSPIPIKLAPTILRIPSIKKKKRFVFGLSKLLQIF